MSPEAVPAITPLIVADCGVVNIRHKHRGDALDDFHWRRDPETARFDASLPLEATFSQFLERLEYDIAFPGPDRRMYALDSPGGQHIGNIMWYHGDHGRGMAEFGISIGREDWRGRGVGTAATIGFLRLVWQTTSFRFVYLHTLAWNDRARRCFRRAGFADAARVLRGEEDFVRMDVRREWWLMWDQEGRFNLPVAGSDSPTAT